MINHVYEQQQLDFLHLCSLGDEKRVCDALLSGRVDKNYQHKSNGWTALHWAASRGHEAVCLILIEAGYPLNCVDTKDRTPYEVCPEEKSKVREILHPSEDMVQGGVTRRSDINSRSSPGFIPNYVRNPAFPYTMKNSFDNCPPAPLSPGSPGPLNSPTYSYGRRDSFNKTRFLLVRTSVEQGKETYKRVTLPGGSDIERLKSTIEKACQGRTVEMIFTLPDNELVNSDEQINSFKDCQKIDVIFKKSELISSLHKKEEIIEKMSDDHKDKVVEKVYPAYGDKDEIEIPSTESDQGVEESHVDEEDSRPLTPPEDLSQFVKEPSPPISLAATDLDSNNGTETFDTSSVTNEEPKLIPLATRNSLDSDPGDFEKVDNEEAKSGDPSSSPAVAGIAAAIPIISAQVEEEKKNALPPPEPVHVAPSTKATVVEESKHVPDDHESSDIATWIHNNPDLVRNVATAAAVAGVVGLGYYVYVKKFK